MKNKISSQPQIFLLHYAGGDRHSFRPLAESLQPHFQIETPELPGRGERMAESFLDNEEKAVADVLEQIKRARRKEVPYLVYGHSMGAILGLEICNAMEKNKDAPVHFVATGYPGPGIKKTAPISGLPKTEFFAEVKKLGGLSDEIMQYEELLDFFEPVLRADFRLVESKSNVIPDIKLQTPIYAVMGETENYSSDISNWVNYTHADCECRIMNGNHFFINQHFSDLSQIIKKLMNAATAK
ncbi:MAG: alpha/beta fold hydrolase [Chryseobacterium sp.]|jgi:surfactin synthase thioesterase subunit|uniref:thioesterase II family protein n=1 Tax=Chryseobacterium sp. TaxID=1871047 RepID=UPI00281D0D6F|nr:alpha/beta fold hydrolase [Chryseobacterium sp.]MDR2234816.1 alpha/beta fold hydrolase [Chryseobacterium sp.]